MKSVEQKMEDMIHILANSLADASKHAEGNNAAGGRVRKILQQVAGQCKELRKQVQSERTDE